MSGVRPPRLSELQGPQLPPFTAEIIRWVRRSVEQLPGDKRTCTDVFYDELFTLAPQVRPMFPEDMDPQKDRLLGALLAAAHGLDKPDAVEPHLRRWGVVHRVKHGVLDEFYVYVGQALVRTMTRLLGNSESMIQSSWVAVYYWMAAVMIDGADQAEAIDRNPAVLLQQHDPEPLARPAMATVHPIRSREAAARLRRRSSTAG